VSPRTALRRLFDGLDGACARVFGDAWNPMYQLGALGWFLFWIVTFSGVYLYIFFDTGITGTYQSIEAITHAQWWAGGIMRSLHRYASDAMVPLVLVHLLREFARDRMRGNHWFAWLTGVPLVGFVYVCGITGYWLVWDTLAQYVALTSSELLDALPLFGEPIARNFVSQASLSDRFFTLMVLIHIAAPLLMLLVMWIHISRHARARVNPARGLGALVLGSLMLLSLLHPALSQPPANLDVVPPTVGLDWFYLQAYPLAALWGEEAAWFLLVGTGLLLALLPWMPPRRTPREAVVDLPNCNGCARCFADCPFGAITLGARTDGLAYEQQAVVDPAQCMSCGLCVGACPTATPFRTVVDLKAGIELPEHPLAGLREHIQQAAGSLSGGARLMVFRCGHGARVDGTPGSVAVLELPCVGMLPPSFVDYVIARRLADGVMLAGCGQGDCHFRLGDRWVEERVAGQRDPWLRERVPRERVAVSWAGRAERARRDADVTSFREALARLPPLLRGGQRQRAPATRFARATWPAPVRWTGIAAALALFAVPLGSFDNWPAWRQLASGHAVIRLSFSHSSRPMVECEPLTPQELAALKPNMRRQVSCPRERWPIQVELERDGELLYRGEQRPAGLWRDGPATIYARFDVPAGPQRLTVRMRNSGRTEGFDYERTESLNLVPEQNLVIGFHAPEGLVIR
jgi:ferredoxin/coenzyme F420-reducing hydrogenase delta subunit